MNQKAAAKAINDFLRALGHEPVGELAQTGQLVAEAWANDLLMGYRHDPLEMLRQGSIATANRQPQEFVALRKIAISTMCPHHLLPAHGHADLLYLPQHHIAGFGTLTRAVAMSARRFALQEQLTHTIAELVCEALDATGALCRLRLQHGCMMARGARETETYVETLAFSGALQSDPELRQTALTLLAMRPS